MTYIIAEIGINHNGDIDLAKKLIDAASDAGCSAVKFQKRVISDVYTKEDLDKPRESPWGTTNREQKEGLEFGQKEYEEIDEYCKSKGIDWSASAWDVSSQRFLRQFSLKFNKVASPLLTDLSLLSVIAEEKRHTYISTGMSTLDQIDAAVEVFRNHSCPFTLMHCTSTYPTAPDEVNLNAMTTIKDRYPDSDGVGFSGHSESIFPSLLAVGLGATVLENHITLDRDGLYGSDQNLSILPNELAELCEKSKEVGIMLGNGVKKVYDREVPVMRKLRKC